VPDDKAARESAVAVAEEAAKPKKKKKKTRDPRREESDPSLTPDKPGVLGLSDGIPVPASLVGDESVPIFIDDADLSVRFPTIQAAVEAVSPMAPDPASRDFDDQEVSSVSAPAGRRPPSPRSIKHPKPSIEAVARASKPKVMQMEDIADTPTETGSVAKTPAIRVLFERALGKATGLLVCSVGGIRKEIYIRDGVPEFVASNVAGELFGSYLVKNDAISQGELAMALAMMPHYGGKLGDTLVGLGLMKPLDVFRHLTRQVRQKLIDVCTWEKGTYTWYIDRESPRKAFPLDIDPYEVLGAGAMALPGSMVDRWVDKHVNLMPEAARRPAVPPERFQLGDEVRAVYDTLDGERSIPELLERFTNDEDRLRYLRILFLLVETQLAT